MKLRSPHSLIAALLGLCALAACSGSDENVYLCLTAPDANGVTICQTFSNVSSEDLAYGEGICTGDGGNIVTACPVTGTVGCCSHALSYEVSEVDCYYGTSASVAQALCTDGKFSSSP